MARLSGARDTKPRMYQGRLSPKDGLGYSLPDSGCEKATEYLRINYPLGEDTSRCLECPLEKCYFDGDNKGHGGRPKKL